jgi:hypothetical protein
VSDANREATQRAERLEAAIEHYCTTNRATDEKLKLLKEAESYMHLIKHSATKGRRKLADNALDTRPQAVTRLNNERWAWEHYTEAEGRPVCGVCQVNAVPLTDGKLGIIVQGFGYLLDTEDEQDARVQLYWWDRVFKAEEDRTEAMDVVFAKQDLAWKIVKRRCRKLPTLARIRRKADRRYLSMTGLHEDQIESWRQKHM